MQVDVIYSYCRCCCFPFLVFQIFGDNSLWVHLSYSKRDDSPATDSISSADPSHSTSVLVGTFNISDQGDGALPDLGRSVSTVLSSFGDTDVGSGGEGANMQVQ
ncbi:hypothetical protein POM88_047294 [Heracleum sosnowskyi]|uniref:Uncharacterized protein n=1 Tax=Heracleum sosnowskyi TaxID=360622 RepID=A0AAD8GT33_9APIA|nr:hypothetical protein POM88_047294 [Heracleum sosnowskyi]